MHAGELLQALEPLSAKRAARWITATLAQAAALREHDHELFPASSAAAQLDAAHRLHSAWSEWADDAERVLLQIKPLIVAGERVVGVEELDYAIGRARAMLRFSPEEMLQRDEQIRGGDVLPLEEVRRELRPNDGR